MNMCYSVISMCDSVTSIMCDINMCDSVTV